DEPLTEIPSNEVEIEEEPQPEPVYPNVEIEKMQAVNDGTFTKNVLSVTSGDTVTYSLTVTNTGDDTAKDVIITDVIPSGLLLVEGSITSGGVENSNRITWNLGNLEVGESRVVSFKVIVPSLELEEDENDAETIEILDENILNEPLSEEVIVSDEVEHEEAVVEAEREVVEDIVITDEESEDTEMIEDIVVTGEEDEETEMIEEESTPEEATIVPYDLDLETTDVISNDSITWELNDILAKTSHTTNSSLEKTMRTWSNIASISYANNPDNPNPEEPNYDPNHPHKDIPSNEVIITEAEYPQLVIEKSQALNTGMPTKVTLEVNEKDQVTYYLTIVNIGNAVAEGITVTDEIPKGLSLVEGSISDGGVQINDVVTWNLGSLEVGESRTISFSVKVPAVLTRTVWTNVAILSYINNPEGQD
ncbi:MAG: DUF11 domain-containing protein, partial [Turicibacter sp.]|nr:DUF11 domain-containing protein [Turicibacter sp.]